MLNTILGLRAAIEKAEPLWRKYWDSHQIITKVTLSSMGLVISADAGNRRLQNDRTGERFYFPSMHRRSVISWDGLATSGSLPVMVCDFVTHTIEPLARAIDSQNATASGKEIVR